VGVSVPSERGPALVSAKKVSKASARYSKILAWHRDFRIKISLTDNFQKTVIKRTLIT